MSDRELVLSFGDSHPAKITDEVRWTWDVVVQEFTKPAPVAEDKSARGWYTFAEFNPQYRDSDNLVARHALTFDFDHVTLANVKAIQTAYADLEYVLYTTASHGSVCSHKDCPIKGTAHPRLRMIMPLSRPAGYDEFQAVSRRIAARAGIELASRETHVPAQMMYMPTKRPGAAFSAKHHKGAWVDVDAVLNEYTNWTDRKEWPTRKDGDGVHNKSEAQTAPADKPGIVGDFCRAFDVYKAIERFGLPYVPTATPDRFTYTAGSRPEGAIIYDGGAKLHSHHDSDPARGQCNAFDLVRLHRFGDLDSGHTDRPVTERPSYRAMSALAMEQPEVLGAVAAAQFEDLGELTEEEMLPEDHSRGGEALARRICDVLKTPTIPRWLIRDLLERGVIAIVAGKRGSYKSFIAMDWTGRVAKNLVEALPGEWQEAVFVISAEGGDYDRRSKAWWSQFGDGRSIDDVPWYVVERRIDLSTREGIELIREECKRLRIKPVLFVLDTFSKLSGGIDENDNSQVKAFIGMLDNGLKRAFDATVLLVAHTGHGDQTRARGASALGADTDAEYIVTRDEGAGIVKLSRERFKASPELPPMMYKPESVDLGYTDHDGRQVTSLIMREATEELTQHGAARTPRGGNQRRVWDVLVDLCSGGVRAKVTAVVERAAQKLVKPEPGKRDRRREMMTRALNELAELSLVHVSNDGDTVSLVRVVKAEEQFEELDEHLR